MIKAPECSNKIVQNHVLSLQNLCWNVVKKNENSRTKEIISGYLPKLKQLIEDRRKRYWQNDPFKDTFCNENESLIYGLIRCVLNLK